MKGMVFTEFLDMVEEKFSPAMADQIICAAPGRTGGAYTAVGKYDHTELVNLVLALSHATQVAVPELIRTFGHHMAGRFATSFARFFTAHDNVFDFLASVDSVIHVEVLKLYPDAELPSFKVVQRGPAHLALVYTSSRHLHDMALGLIEGAAAHFEEPVTVTQQALEDGSVRFDIHHVAHAAAA